MSLLPSQLPFNLGSATELPTVLPYGLTTLLPMNTLPFTLSAKVDDVEVPYGSVGWEVVCKSGQDFQTEIFRTSELSPPTFSKELSGTGMASVTFDLDYYLFTETLRNGRPVEDLFDYENLWEIHFDKKVRFQFLGTATRETPVDSTEIRTATVSGNGIAQVLNWASVYPPNFPEVRYKVETLRDVFSGDAIDNTIWNMTSTLNGGIAIVRQGQKEEILATIERLTADKTNKTQEVNQAASNVTSATTNYNAVYKNSSSTAADKKEASKQLSAAKAEHSKLLTQLDTLNKQLVDANLKNTLAPNLIEGDSASRARLTVNSSGDTKTLAAGYFDFQSSGISAKIEPLPQAATGGQARTTFGVINSQNSWAYFFTAAVNGSRRLVAEVNDNGLVYTDDFDYNATTDAFWRIREDHRKIIFETSPTGETWTRKFEVPDVSWIRGEVSVVFKAQLDGNAGVYPPLHAYITEINTTAIPAVDSVMATYAEYVEQAQARGSIPYVSLDFTDEVDSAGASWVGKPNVTVPEGIDLLQLLKNFAQLQQFDWVMDNDFKLKVYQKVWNPNESDPTVAFHKEDQIVLHEAGTQLTRERNRDRSGIGNVIVGRNATGQYAYIQDEDSIGKFQRREMFIDAGSAPDLESLGTILQASLSEVADEKSSWRIVVDPDLPGKRVFEDYDVGDWVAIEMIDSTGKISKNAWRIVGIAIRVSDETGTTAELTLQSRMQLLAERLQQQVANMNTSATSAGVTLGRAVSAATLIEQAKLSNLLDVSMPPADSRNSGDVLTWTGSYFTLTTPGDKTVPGTPQILEVASNVYYPETGISTKAQIMMSWTTPLNTDGSTITDGHHYEIRFRPEATLPVGTTWENAGQKLWTELHTWSQPTAPPIENTGWQIVFVGFDENSTIIQELSPGVRYEFQIRAVDSSTPQHFGEWSDTYVHGAAEDTIPPPQPAAPEIVASRLAVQVIHYLGKEDGGTYNLPPDMSHLEVHVGGPSFFPSESTYVGKIIADVSVIRGRTPVIQTFQVDSTENVFVRVIAVDRTGNKSTPSKAATPVTANLIDDAHISDLTASKITAGTISSAIILSGSIKTAEDGPRAEMNFEGFRIFGEDEDETISLLGNPGLTGNFLMIKDLENPDATLAGIDGTGRGSFQSVTVADDITIQGVQLIEDLIDPRPKGVIALGVYEGDPVVGAGVGLERGFLEISFIAEESRSYMITAVTEFDSTSTSTERMLMRLLDYGENAPVLPTNLAAGPVTRLSQSLSHITGTSGINGIAHVTYAGTFTPGLHRVLWTFAGQLGNPTISAQVATNTPAKSIIWVEDIGIPITDTVIVNDGGVDAAGTTTPVKPPSVTPKAEYTKNYACTWSGTYRSTGAFSSSHGNTIVQGDSGADSWLNDARGLMGFPYSQIMTDLRGATIKSCYVTLYANHWWWNDGGTARIGTHNYTSRPGSVSSSRYTAQRVSSSNWPKPGKRKVSLGTTIGNEFKSGAAKGLILGPTDGSKRQYGRFNGNGQSYEPVLTVTYVK